MPQKTTKQIRDEIKETVDLTQKLQAEMSKVSDEMGDILKHTFGSLKDYSKDVLDRLESTGDMGAKAANRIMKEMKKATSEIEFSFNDATKIAQKFSEDSFNVDLYDKIYDTLLSPFDFLKTKIDNIPLIGDILSKSLRLESIKENISKNIELPLTGAIANGKFSLSSIKEIGGAAFKAIGTRVLFVTTGIAALVGLLKITIDRFKELDQTTREFRMETGFIGENLERVNDLVRSTTVDLARYGVTAEQSRDAITAINNQFGSLAMATKENVKNISLLTATIGLGADEGVKLVALFDSIKDSTGLTAENMIASTIETSKLAGVAPKQVLSDIANSSERMFEFMSASPDVLINTAVQARKLGISLDQVAGIAEKLTDFESSIEAEMNAMVLTGRQLNLEQARYFAITGETNKMMQEIQKNVGGIEELNKMLPYQQKAFAEAIGLSVGELRKMIQNQEISEKLADGTIDAYTALQKGQSLADVLKTKDVLTPLENLQNAFKAIIVSLADVLVPIFKALAPVLTGIAGVLGWVADGINYFGNAITWVSGIILTVFIAKAVAGMITSITSMIGSLLGLNVAMMATPIGWVVAGLTAIAGAAYLIINNWDAITDFFSGWGAKILYWLKWPFVKAWEFLFGNTIWSSENIAMVFNDILDTLRVVGNAIIDILILPFEIVWNRIQGIFSGIGDMVMEVMSTVGSIFGTTETPNMEVQPTGATAAVVVPGQPNIPVNEGIVEPTSISLESVVNRLDTLISLFESGVALNLTPAGGTKLGEVIARNARK